MDVTLRIAFLEKIQLFQGLSPTDIKYIAENILEKNFDKDDIIFREGDVAKAMYLIVSGEVAIYKGKRELVRLSPGAYIGEMAILDSRPRSATAVALIETILLAIPETVFRSTLLNCTQSLLFILRNLAKRIRINYENLEKDHLQLSTLIHDIKSTLSAFSYAALLKNKVNNDGQALTWIERILETQEYLGNMLRDALDKHAGYTAGYVFDKDNILETLEHTINFHLALHPDIKKNRIKLRVDRKPFYCQHNRSDMVRVIANLVINACQASDKASEVQIVVSGDEDSLTIEIIDHGRGIPVEIRDKIFEPGFTSKASGTGLGLTSARTIIEKYHRGSLSFTSEQGQGSTFRITLPVRHSL